MKFLSTKKILLTCLTVIFAFLLGVTVAFGYRSAYAAVNPDDVAVYAEGEGGETEGGATEGGETEGGETGGDEGGETPAPDDEEGPGEGGIAPPNPPDDDTDFDISFQEIIVQVNKLKLKVTGWKQPINPTSRPIIDTNPDGEYSPELVAKIDALLANYSLITTSVWDANGAEIKIEDINSLAAGSKFYIHIDINEDYAPSVELVFEKPEYRSCAGEIGFPSGTKLTPIPTIPEKDREVNIKFDGTDIDIKEKALNNILKGREALTIIESESDELVKSTVGTFYYVIGFKSTQHCWDNPAVKNDRSDVIITVNILPETLPVTVNFGDIYYTGFEIDVAEKLKEAFKDYVDVATGYTTVGTDVGEYEIHLVIKDEYANAVKWEGDAEDPLVLTWNILQSTIKGEWETYGHLGRINITSETYKGGVEGAIKYKYTDKVSGEVVTKLEVGKTYQVEVELINENLTWSDDTVTTFEFTLAKEIVELKKPEIDATSKEYNGAAQTFKITIDGVDVTDEQFAEYLEIVEEESDSLTQTAVGNYKVVIRLKNDASWTGNFMDDVVINFSIDPLELNVEWNEQTGIPKYVSNYVSEDYSSIVSCTYTDADGNPVTFAQMEVGGNYVGKLTLLDEESFKWAEDAVLEYPFTLQVAFKTVELPAFENTSVGYSGSIIKNYPAGWDTIKGNLTILSGSFEQTDAGDYEVVVKVKEGFIWVGEGSDSVALQGDTAKFKFTINKAVLTGEWQQNGKVNFTSSFLGNYDDVVVYEYTDSNGNAVSYSELVEGQTYTVSVKLKEGMEGNFDGSQLPAPTTITFKQTEDEGSKFPWWIFLIIGIVLLIIIIIIIIIIVLKKKRKKDDDYDDFYDDEYYGDEEGGEGSGEGGDYDDYDDYSGDSY